MSFLSESFLFMFLPLGVAVYYLLGAFRLGTSAKNTWLLIASLVLFAWLEPAFIPLLVLSILYAYFIGKRLKHAIWEGLPTRRYIVATYIICGGTFLLFQLLATAIRDGWPLWGLEYGFLRGFALPVGAGIITMRTIGYVSDVYRKKIEAEQNIARLSLYISFFPSIVVGPMANYEEFLPQLMQRPFKRDLFFEGVCRFVIGLGKKILLAGNLAVISDEVFRLSTTSDSLTQVPVSLAWLGLLAFVLQVFYDFSAYTDMAIGIAGMFGFSCRENFRYPYLAASMTDFWNRWHITIKGWFDRYVASPLDRNRAANKDQLVVNTFFVFVLMGLWYRASVGILIWALVQVFFITVEKVITYDRRNIPRFFKHLYVVLVLALSFSLFRSGNLYQVLLFLRNLLGMNQNGLASPMALTFLREYWLFLAAGLVFAFPLAPYLHKKAAKGKSFSAVAAVAYPILLFGVFALCMLYLARGLYAPHAYFNF